MTEKTHYYTTDRDDWKQVAHGLSQDPVLDETRCEGEWEDDDDLENVDNEDVGETEVDILLVELLLDDQQEDDEVPDTADDNQDYEEEEDD